MQVCEGCGQSIASVSEGRLDQQAAVCTLPQFFVADLVGPADLQDLPQAGVNEDLDFLIIRLWVSVILDFLITCANGIQDRMEKD
jgi:hypothetical protein